MQLQSVDGTYTYHLQITPGGWNLCCMASDRMYEPPKNLVYENLLAEKLKAEGRRHFRPVFCIDFVRGTVINVTWASELIQDSEAATIIHGHLDEIRREYDLAFVDLVGDLECQTILNGFSGNRFIKSALINFPLEPTNTSQPAKR